MARLRNTDSRGNAFSRPVVDAVWNKGRVIQGYSPLEWRHDMCGAPMRYTDHGSANSQYGWEVDHIRPVASGGGDELENLQPLQWENNRRKGDTFPWRCP
jgi:hypothetical protein